VPGASGSRPFGRGIHPVRSIRKRPRLQVNFSELSGYDTSGVPWDFGPLGLDLNPAADSASVIATPGGIVEELKVFQNERNGMWQVNRMGRFVAEFVCRLRRGPMAHSESEIRSQ
jgi:hypothetical protein